MPKDTTLEIMVADQSGFASTESTIEKATVAFDALGESLEESILPLRKRIEASPNAPDELEIQFELAFKGEAKWIVVSAGASATVRVKAAWKRRA